jgi:hypothetical protein
VATNSGAPCTAVFNAHYLKCTKNCGDSQMATQADATPRWLDGAKQAVWAFWTSLRWH